MIWIPAVIYLFVTERFLGAVGLMAWGTLVVGMADNFLRPIIIGRDTEVPELMILLSILGGLATFGIPGLIFGPVLVSLLVSALEIYSRVYHKALSNN
jgi:predicted PurR-regulated permease PerM